MTPNVAGLLLAAGEGSRLGRPKALIMLGGRSLAARGVALLHDGGTTPVVVVTGAVGAEAVAADLSGATGTGPFGREPADGRLADVRIIDNPRWGSGMGSSLATGLAALSAAQSGAPPLRAGTSADAGAVVVALADQPLVGPQAVGRLIAAYHEGASVAVACYAGKPRNPVLIAREHWPEVIARAEGDVGARPFLRAHQDLVRRVECGDTGRPDDVDTPEDLELVRRLLADTATFPA
ncbi:MAG TPA: nucleotidyltransferase family protein [Streptosporangiaceae bacterium]|jgi:nicotine blue oxidoreductase